MLPTTSALGADPPDKEVAGTYYLEGVVDVDAELRLKPDGRFSFGLAYGGVEKQAFGTWVLRDKRIELVSDAARKTDFSVGSLEPQMLKGYVIEEDKPTLMTVRISTPHLGLTWSNMEIFAEFSNGKVRSGITGSSGMIGFLARDEPEWRGAVVRRIGAAYPWKKIGPRWFDVDPEKVKGVEIHFEPGPLMSIPLENASLNWDAYRGFRMLRDDRGALGKAGRRFVAKTLPR